MCNEQPKSSHTMKKTEYKITYFLLILFISGTNAAARVSHYHYITLVNQFLGPHNTARAALGMPPLVWDKELASYAQSYANQRRLDCDLKHSNGPYGENIFWGSGNDWTPAQAVMSWVSERRWYDYWSNSCVGDQDCGHYTQIVWRSTIRVGCARVICFEGKGVFMTCNYDPPGNYIGEKPY